MFSGGTVDYKWARGNFLGDGNILSVDCAGVYMRGDICQSTSDYIFKMGEFLMYLNYILPLIYKKNNVKSS